MLTRSRVACRLAASIVLVLAAVACAPKPASPTLMARCTHLYNLWWTYDEDPVFFGVAEKSQAELALYNCQQGKYDEGIAALEQLLRRGGFDLSRVEGG